MATNVSTSLTPAQRRRAVLDKKGVGTTRRLTTAAPNKVFWGILAVASLLTVFGLMMVLSATSIEAVNRGGSPWAMFQKQFMWSIFGLFAGITTYRMPYHQWHGFVRAHDFAAGSRFGIGNQRCACMGGTWSNSIPAFGSAEGNHVVVLRQRVVAKARRNCTVGTHAEASDVRVGDHCGALRISPEGPWRSNRVYLHCDGNVVHCRCTNSVDGDDDYFLLSGIAWVDCHKFATAKSILRIR